MPSYDRDRTILWYEDLVIRFKADEKESPGVSLSSVLHKWFKVALQLLHRVAISAGNGIL